MLLEKEVLGGLLVSLEFLQEVRSLVFKEDFEDLEVKGLVGALLAGNFKQSGLGDSALAKEAQFMVESQLDGLGGNTQALHKELLKSFAIFKIGAIKRRQKSLQNEIKNAENSSNKEELDKLNKEFAQISFSRHPPLQGQEYH